MVGWFLTGGAVPVFLVICGSFFLWYLRGGPFRSPGKLFGALRGKRVGGGVSPFRALMMALAGTLGVGNIVGVANALWVGGAGAVFWMWISALLAMILKYAEILLAVSHRREGREGHFFGGAVYYIKDCFESRGRYFLAAALSGAFAVLILLNALSMGCVIQVNAIASAFSGVAKIPPVVCGLVLVAVSLPVLFCGSRRISAMTEYLVPIMTAGFLLLSGAVLFLRRDAVPTAFASVFREALHPESVAGGAFGFLTSRALRVGTMRGLLSNEAGCGTAPTAHAAADAPAPAAQGVLGIFEVFVDTVLLCTVTAMVILVNYDAASVFGDEGMMMAIRAYTTVLGDFSGWFLCIAVFFFGYGTVLCWGAYGLESLRYLTGNRIARAVFLMVFGAGILFGSLTAPESVWSLADFAIASLTEVNLVVLLLMRKEIRQKTEEYFPAASGRKKRAGDAGCSRRVG